MNQPISVPAGNAHSPAHASVSGENLASDAAVSRIHRVPAPEPRSAQLVTEHFAFIWRLLRRLGLPKTDADDAAQQVFLAAHKNVENIAHGSERSYLYGCALNHASRHRSHQARAQRHVRDDALAETMAPAESTDSEHLLEQQQGRLVLDQILDALPPELRTVFVLYELEQVDTYQIADLLLIARGTVVSRLRRAREIFEQRAERFRRNLPPQVRSTHD